MHDVVVSRGIDALAVPSLHGSWTLPGRTQPRISSRAQSLRSPCFKRGLLMKEPVPKSRTHRDGRWSQRCAAQLARQLISSSWSGPPEKGLVRHRTSRRGHSRQSHGRTTRSHSSVQHSKHLGMRATLPLAGKYTTSKCTAQWRRRCSCPCFRVRSGPIATSGMGEMARATRSAECASRSMNLTCATKTSCGCHACTTHTFIVWSLGSCGVRRALCAGPIFEKPLK
mmetsp:Transcript_320/g.1362  ORF Transcript_320/g.1362 Transcript_320/m.1362 type:complete len:226 (-) Transcript_320:268-945(-)